MPGANIYKGKTKKWHTYVTYTYLLLVSILGAIQKTSGHGSGQVALLEQGCWTRLLQEVPSDHGHSVISLSLLSRALWIALGKQQDPVCCQDSPRWPWFLAGTTMSLQSSPQYKCRLTGKVLQQWRPSKTGWFGQTGSRQCFLITWQSAPCADPAQPQ